MLLDHCFNDLESFVTKLQQVAVAYKELDRRKTIRISKNIKQLGGNNLTQVFVLCFAAYSPTFSFFTLVIR